MKRKVCVLTGTRGGYGVLKPLMLEIRKSKLLQLQVVASAMHLLKRFGYTVSEIERDGIKIDAKLNIAFDYDSGEAMAKSIAKGINSFTACFKRLKPAVVVILGDRMEAFAASVAAACLNIPIGHLHGGDSAGAGVDEVFRYNVSKFANIHFAATKKSAARLKAAGEQPWRIHVVGAPGLDSVCAAGYPKKRDVCNRLGLDSSKPIILAAQHSVTTEPNDAARQIGETMEALRQLGEQAIVVYPNCDAGGRRMIKVIERYRKVPFIKLFKNIEHNLFVGLLHCAGAMVGNSSCGIVETPSVGLPTVNIGTRQLGRERSTNVIDVPHDSQKIKKAIRKALYDKRFIARARNCKSPYGNGTAGKKIVKILEGIKIDARLLQKKTI